MPSSLSYSSSYALSLGQNGPGTDVSPPFSVISPPSLQTTAQSQSTNQNATMTMNGTFLAVTPGCTGTEAVVATSTYWDTTCGCMKTAVAPTPTDITSTLNYSMPLISGSSMPSPSPYLITPHGRAARLDILSGKVGFLEGGFALAMAAFMIG